MAGIFSLSEHALERDLIWLFDTVNAHIEKLSFMLSGCGITSPGIPRRVGSRVVPYSFSGYIFLLYDYARGKQSLSREYIEDATKKLANLIFTSALAPEAEDEDDDDAATAQVNWQLLEGHPVGVVYMAATARVKLSDGSWLNEDELYALTGLSPERAEQQNIQSRMENGTKVFEPAAIRQLLAKEAFSVTTD